MAMSIPLLVTALGGWVGTVTEGWMRWVGLALSLAGGTTIIALAVQGVRPRMAVQDHNLLVFLRLGAPLAIPLSKVECVFLGRPETQLTLGQRNRMVSLVIRLAEAATDYKAREVKPSLGRWEEGYITIHGAWCEPLTLELAQRINARLRDAHRIEAEKMEA